MGYVADYQKDEVIIFVTEAKGPGVQLWKFDDLKKGISSKK